MGSGVRFGESFEVEEGSDLTDCLSRRGYEGGLDRTIAHITLVMLRRCWKVSQAQLFGLLWPGPWKSRPGTGRKVRCLTKLQATLKHLLRLNLPATNIEFWLSKAFAPLPRFFLENYGAYRHCVHT